MNLVIYRYLRLRFAVRQWLFKQLTPMGLGVLVCWAIAGFVGLGSPQSLCDLIFLLTLTLLVLAAIGSRFIEYRFSATRRLPRFGTVGNPLQYQVVVRNLTPQPQRGLKLIENFPDFYPEFREFISIKRRYPIGRRWVRLWHRYVAQQQRAIAHPRDLPTLSARTKTKVTGEILPLRRGRLCFESITLACPDPLGLVYKRNAYDSPQAVCILPRRYQLPPLNLPGSRRYQSGKTPIAASIGEALEFRSLRDYRPGDPTNKIHWRSWAKVGRPIVREHQDESAVHYALILDTFQQNADGELFEEALAVAISFLTQDQTEESLLDVIYAAPKPHCFTVGRSRSQREKVLENLATLIPSQGQTIDTLTPMVQNRLPRLSGCICILIDFEEAQYSFLQLLSQYGIPIKVLFLCDSGTHKDKVSGCLLSPQCRVHFISVDQIQQDLLRI